MNFSLPPKFSVAIVFGLGLPFLCLIIARMFGQLKLSTWSATGLTVLFFTIYITYALFLWTDVFPAVRNRRFKWAANTFFNYTVILGVICMSAWDLNQPYQGWSIREVQRVEPAFLQWVNDWPILKKYVNLGSSAFVFLFIASNYFQQWLLILVTLWLGTAITNFLIPLEGRPVLFQQLLDGLKKLSKRVNQWMFEHKDKLIHIVIWILLFYANWKSESILAVVCYGVLSIGFFYTNFIWQLHLLNYKRYISIAFLLFGSYLLVGFLDILLPKEISQSGHWKNFWILPMGAFLGAFVERTNIIQRERMSEILQRNELTIQLQQAQLQSLTQQINQHFLFNSLNFIYARSQQYSKELAESVQILSDIMRYILRNLNQESLVPLEEEVQHLCDFTEFVERIEPKRIDFKQDGSFAYRSIIPLLFTVFVENAVKHGDLSDPEQPVRINLSVIQNQLTFTVSNKKWVVSNPHRPISTQIGLVNVRKRLAFAYPNRHALEINDMLTTYSVCLTINL